MHLTPEQQQQLQQAKAAGEKRVTLRFTAEQRSAWQDAVQQELGGKEENLALFRQIKAAAEQPGFFGDVRRALVFARRPVDELAQAIGVDSGLLSAFRAGEAELPSVALDRLLDLLNLRLMHEIPR